MRVSIGELARRPLSSTDVLLLALLEDGAARSTAQASDEIGLSLDAIRAAATRLARSGFIAQERAPSRGFGYQPAFVYTITALGRWLLEVTEAAA